MRTRCCGITARFLEVDYTTIMIGHRMIDGGLSVLTEDPGKVEEPDGWAVIEFRGTASKEAVAKRMVKDRTRQTYACSPFIRVPASIPSP